MIKASQLFSNSEILKLLTPSQSLGFIVEYIPKDTFIDLEFYSTDKKLSKLIRTDFKNIQSLTAKIDSSTLVILDASGVELSKNQEILSHINCFDLGVVVNRSFHILNFPLPRIKGFYHFPISEDFDQFNWSLDEIYLFLRNIQKEPIRGPRAYSIFNPAWKYKSSILPKAESLFHSQLNPTGFKEACFETMKNAKFRKYLTSITIFENLLFFSLDQLNSNPIDRLKRQFYSTWTTIIIPNLKALQTGVLSTLRQFYKSIEPLWCKYIYWPIEYQIRNRGHKLTQKEYEDMKTQEADARTQRKQEKQLRKR